MYVDTRTCFSNGRKFNTYVFNTNEEAINFMKENDKIKERYSCFESSSKYYVCYYVQLKGDKKKMKINIFVNGKYVYSTNKYQTCKEAIAELKQKKNVEVASVPNYKIFVSDGDIITAKSIKN